MVFEPLRGAARLAGRTAARLAATLGMPGTRLGSGTAPKIVWTAETPAPVGSDRSRRPKAGVAPVRRARFELPGGPNAPGAARAVVRGELAGALDGRRLDDALVLISELVMNSVLHGSADERHPVVVHLALAPERVRVEVCDEGPGFDPRTVRRGARRGFGMLLLQRMARSWGVTHEAGMACVWFELDRAKPARSRTG